MDNQSQTRMWQVRRKVSAGLTLALLLLGGAALAGWFLDLEVLRSFVPGAVPAKANTALGFILLSVALGLYLLSREFTWTGRWTQVFALLTVGLGLNTLGGCLMGWNSPFDDLVISPARLADGRWSPGEMAPGTALGLIMLGAALGIARYRWAAFSVTLLALATGFFAVASGLAQVFGLTDQMGFGPLAKISAPAMTGFILACGALWFAQPRWGLLREVNRNRRGEHPTSSASPGPGAYVLSPPQPLAPASGPGEERGFGLGLLVVTAFLVFNILVVGVLNYQAKHRKILQSINTELSTIAGLKVAQIAAWREERLGDARVLRAMPLFENNARDFLAHPASTADREVLLQWFKALDQMHPYAGFALLDVTGQPRLAVPSDLDVTPTELRAVLAQAAHARDVLITDLYRGRGGAICLDLVIPLGDHAPWHEEPTDRDWSASALGGLVVLRINPAQSLYPMIQSWPTPSTSGETLLVERQGNEVVFLNKLRHQASAPLTLHRPLQDRILPAALAVRGRTGQIEGVDYRGAKVFAIARPVPNSNWVLIAKIDQSEVYGPLRRETWNTAIILSILLLAIGAGAGLVWRHRAAALAQHALESERERNAVAERLALVTQQANDSILILDHEGLILEANQRALDVYGYSLDELRALPPGRLRPPGSGGSLAADLDRIRSPAGGMFETMHRRKNGEIFEVEFNGRGFTLEGNPCMLCIIRDISSRKRLEEAIRQSEERYRLIAEHTKDIIWLYDLAADHFTYISPSILSLVGYTPDEIQGRSFSSILTPESAGKARGLLGSRLAALQAGESTDLRHTGTFDHQHKDGTIRVGEVISTLLPDAPGRPTRLMGVTRDVTERLRAAQALVKSEELLNATAEAANMGGWELALPSMTLTWTRQIYRILDAAPDFSPTLENMTGFFAPASRPAMTDALRRAIKAGESFDLELGLITANGQHLIVHSVGRAQWTNGRVSRIFGTIQDLTFRKRAEERLQLQSAALEAMVESVMITDLRGNIEWVNPAFTKTSGYSREEVIGQNPRILKSGRQADADYADLWRTINTGQTWSGELTNRSKSGVLYTEGVTITPVLGRDGAGTHFVAVKENITEKRAMERQLIETQRLESIGMLASGIAHDLNNVLAPISLSIAMMRQQYPLAQDKLDMIEKCTLRGAGIIRQVLTFARGAGEARSRMRLGRLIKEMMHLMAETFPRNIDATYDISLAEDYVLVDPTQIHQVLLNLAVNARDALPRGGELSFKLERKSVSEEEARINGVAQGGEFVVIKVRDTGLGIQSDVLPHIFEPFYSTKPRGQGTGLGLSTVHGIVRSHGGFIRVESELGLGTEFQVYLPAVPSPEVAASGSASAAPFDLGRGELVLVADDEAVIREITQLVLKKSGFTVLVAEDGTQALELFRAQPGSFKVVILDRMMPGMSGEEAAANIRRLSPQVPIILSTGLLSEGAAELKEEELKRLGITAILYKPYTEADFLKMLRSILPPRA